MGYFKFDVCQTHGAHKHWLCAPQSDCFRCRSFRKCETIFIQSICLKGDFVERVLSWFNENRLKRSKFTYEIFFLINQGIIQLVCKFNYYFFQSAHNPAFGYGAATVFIHCDADRGRADRNNLYKNRGKFSSRREICVCGVCRANKVLNKLKIDFSTYFNIKTKTTKPSLILNFIFLLNAKNFSSNDIKM